MYKFCTLFDKNYLYRGLALYSSLKENCPNFLLWILCMDNTTLDLLKKANLKNVKLISVEDFENDALKKVKKERNNTEYSWTCGANLCWYLLNKIDYDDLITYLDADTFFFQSPDKIFNEIGTSSIAIVEHRLIGYKKTLEKYVGKYNVGWVSFRKDEEGLKASEWWKDKVLEWCFAYFKNGMIGDQHYLNDWQKRFKNVCIIKNEGVDVAPWNINNLKISLENNKIMVGSSPLIFYHFHSFSIENDKSFRLATAYYIPRTAKKIYEIYINKIKESIEFVSSIDSRFNFGFKKRDIKSYVSQILFKSRLFEYLYIRYSCYKLKKTVNYEK